MAYFSPYIDDQGLHIPTYSDIRDDLIENARYIFGQDIYLGIDSQDYQWISVVASKINDTLQAIQFAYNSRGPGTAIGSSLDILVKLNGIRRGSATYSTCIVSLTGTPGTVITNGVVQDSSGYYWNLPSVLTIGTGGTVSAQATCQNEGPIAANVGDISVIATPTYGWTSVTNEVSALQGVNSETDSQIRSRQAISTAQPSRTVLEGTEGAIAAVAGVTRKKVYENDTAEINALGLPPKSITAVVEGGSDSDIAQALYLKKGPGCLTNGTTVVNITDQLGNITPIGFYRPSYVDVDIVINVRQLSGYTTATTDLIRAAIVNFLNAMTMGANSIPVNNFYGPALSAQNLSVPTFSVTSITAARHGGTLGTNDIIMAFNEAVRGNASYVTINVS